MPAGLDPDHPLRRAGDDDTVIVQCKHHMSDLTYATAHEYIQPSDADRLLSNLPTGVGPSFHVLAYCMVFCSERVVLRDREGTRTQALSPAWRSTPTTGR